MPITNYCETSRVATELLNKAIKLERGYKWLNAIHTYGRLISLISPDSLPPDFSPSDGYRLVLYEVYSHLGFAYQRFGDHTLALKHCTKAIDLLTNEDTGHAVGCRSRELLAIPVYCKRAFSQALLGDYSAALKDVDSALKFDDMNLDLLCLTALIHNTFNEHGKAMKILAKGLNQNKAHSGCRVLRQWLKAEGCSPSLKYCNIEESKEVTSLRHPNVIEFMDRFLHTLSIPHTTETVCLTPPTPPQNITHSLSTMFESNPPRRSHTASSPHRGGRCYCQQTNSQPKMSTGLADLSWKKSTLSDILPFKCGALPALFERDPVREETTHFKSQRRRDEYSSTLRKHAQRMRLLTQDEFIDLLESSNSKKLTEWKRKQQQGVMDDTITISAFRPVNTRNVPRLYTKAWRGDRLHSAPLSVKETQPIFYPAYS